ncbi:MAG: RluA family pseudouridine synthase [Holosporales bacterium]|jgi:23S rRNA pseudouridine955/2504/2580 synthase|nr:RluA family pseudouridine synthase [Holosporales bacterium]
MHDHEDYQLSRLDRHIRRLYGKSIPQSVIEKAVRSGAILINEKKAKARDMVSGSDSISINPSTIEILTKFDKRDSESPHRLSANFAKQFSDMIIYEDENIIMINKPAGLAAQLGSKTQYAVDVMAKSYNMEARLVHRIDKDTSGIVALAKNIETSRYMLELFQFKRIRKKYIAIVDGHAPHAKWRISEPLLKRKDSVVIDYDNGKEAITEFRVIKSPSASSMTALEAIPITGRTHQIRVHLASVNCPIVGDKKYGGSGYKRLCLHAYEISFTLRSGELIKQRAEIPEYFLLDPFLKPMDAVENGRI